MKLFKIFHLGLFLIAILFLYQNCGNNLFTTMTPYQSFTFSAGGLPTIANLSGLQAVVWPNRNEPGINWDERTRDVQAVNTASHVITLVRPVPTVLSIGIGARFCLQGRPEFLDAPGEFYYDSAIGTLYYYPFDGLSPNGRNIYAPSFVTMISLRGSSSSAVQNITFDGISFLHGGASREDDRTGAIMLNYSTKNIIFEACRLENLGSIGISVTANSSGIIVHNSLLQNIGSYGIYIGGNSSGDISHEHLILNNRLSRIGQLVGHGDAIFLSQSSRSYIAHNQISDTRRHSIELVASWDGNETTNFTRSNLVEYNDVSLGNTDSEDTGLIYMWGYVWRNVVRYNRVHDSLHPLEEGSGIYLDGWSVGTTVDSNVVCNLGGATGFLRSAIVAHGANHRIINNVFKNNTIRTMGTWGAPAFGAVQLGYSNPGGPHGGHIFEHNIFFRTGDIQYSTFNYENNLLASVNNNLYWGHDPALFVRWKTAAQPGAQSLTFEQWQTVGFDKQSRVGDPRFLDPQGCNISLPNDSPAFAVGFQKFSTDTIGLDSTFPFDCNGNTTGDCTRRNKL